MQITTVLCVTALTMEIPIKNLPNFACPNYIATDVEDDEDDEDDEDGENDEDDEDGEDDKEDPDIPKNLQWSFTINFAEQTNIVIQRTERMKFCENGQIYNIISSRCERFSC